MCIYICREREHLEPLMAIYRCISYSYMYTLHIYMYVYIYIYICIYVNTYIARENTWGP